MDNRLHLVIHYQLFPAVFMAEALGWISSFILILTIARQVYKQWQEGTSEGVSKWLFFGQIAASIGFLTYSLMIWSPVFIATNAIMVLNSLAGLGILFHHRRREQKTAQSE